ncbi:unnamed protein product, partial [Cyprideis torosa]
MVDQLVPVYSGSLVIDSITSGGKLDAPVGQRIFWALLEGGVAAALLFAGGLKALQSAVISIGLPFAADDKISDELWNSSKAKFTKLTKSYEDQVDAWHFSGELIEKMILKSVFGYSLAFVVALMLYLVIAQKVESRASIRLMD